MEIRVSREYMQELNRRRQDPRADLFIPNGRTIYGARPPLILAAFHIGGKYVLRGGRRASFRAS